MINFKQLSIKDVILIEPQIFEDERGFFYESFNQKEFEEAIEQKVNFVQDNTSFSKKNVLRGLHFQIEPFSQGKLVQVMEGDVLDVVVDIRKSSPTYGKHVRVNLSSDNKYQIWIPPGFAHGFVVYSDHAKFFYKVTNYYSPNHEKVLKWNDNDLNIDWGCSNPILSKKDIDNALSFKKFSLL